MYGVFVPLVSLLLSPTTATALMVLNSEPLRLVTLNTSALTFTETTPARSRIECLSRCKSDQQCMAAVFDPDAQQCKYIDIQSLPGASKGESYIYDKSNLIPGNFSI